MLVAGKALTGYVIEASDGHIGVVDTFLFDDKAWNTRWLVVDTGHWLAGRQVLVHPSAIGRPDHERRHLPVGLTKSQVEASPDILRHQPVTMQMQRRLYEYYGSDPYGGLDFYGAGLTGLGLAGGFRPSHGEARLLEADAARDASDKGDPHLRSMAAIGSYHIHATDGLIGHVENFLLDDAAWTIRYLIVDTRNWWFGAHVLISPYAVQSIDWGDRQVRLNVSRDQVKASPPWNAADVVERIYERRLHDHYGWRGYGW